MLLSRRLPQSLACALALGVVAPGQSAHAQNASPQGPTPSAPEVRTAASASRSLRPDLGIVNLTITSEGATPRVAGRRVAARADSLRNALVALGIPRDSLVSRSRWWWWHGRLETVMREPRWVEVANPAPNGPRQRLVQDTSYRARDVIEVRIRDLARMGAVIDTAYSRGVTEIAGVQFQVSDAQVIAAAQAELLGEATRLARQQAEAIATAGGMRLGRVIEFSTRDDGDSRYGYPMEGVVSSVRSASSSAGTEIVQPGIPLRVTVYARWELVPTPR